METRGATNALEDRYSSSDGKRDMTSNPEIIMWRSPFISTVEMGFMIIAEASISFLGFGIPPPYPSWGGMLSGQGRGYMLQSPWLAIWPGLFLSLAVFGINMFSDGLRDILDPRLKGRMGVFRAFKRKKHERIQENEYR